jgi:DNA replication protein DnaC
VNSNQRKKFKFDKVLDSDANQEDIFEEVQDLIESSMEGYNVCIMSYGQTGSGKTYTMVGDDKNPGLYFTAVDEIYNIIKEKQDRI